MSGSTSILDLPTEPMGGGGIGQNISFSASENIDVQNKPVPQQQVSSNQGGVSLDQSTINQIVNGLQQASASGATQLSSRDIPMVTTSHNTDPYIQPNYVPPPSHNTSNYIQANDQPEDMINKYNRNYRKEQTIDNIYSEIQIPLLLAILYFLFQLPIVRKTLFTYVPILFSIDGNMNLNGFVLTSIVFAFLFYIINKMTNQLGVF